jgi:hypothetical protein
VATAAAAQAALKYALGSFVGQIFHQQNKNKLE